MKWITKIRLRHYRAFGDDVPAIDISLRHHLLIYGENGSGKSSLYHALRDFIISSPAGSEIEFRRNVFSVPDNSGSISVTIADTVSGSSNEFAFNEDDQTSTHRHAVIQEANYYKGFLDYRRMLQLHSLDVPEGDRPNVFRLLVEDLLADVQITDPFNPTSIRPVPLNETYQRIKSSLLRKGRWRGPDYLKTDLDALQNFSVTFRALLDTVFPIAQNYLNNYFKANVLISHQTADIEYDDREIEEDSRLIVIYSGHNAMSYQYFLNEARLSAIALSINLASLKINPPPAGTLKVLYLDDVFIGMDTSNRLPLLDILFKEFINPTDGSEPTQVIISTYDRQWYEVIQRHFEGLSVLCAKYELYRLPEDLHDRPLVIPFEANFDNAIRHLRSTTRPDYPAAANYLRKYAEELIQGFLPDHERRNRDENKDGKEKFAILPEYKLGAYLDRTIDLYERFGWNVDLLNRLKNALPTLLHPLSHFELNAPVYKGELEEAVEILLALKQQFENDTLRFKTVLPPQRIFLTFQHPNGDWDRCEIDFDRPIYAVRDEAGQTLINYPACVHKKSKTKRGDDTNGGNVNIGYQTFEVAYQTILTNINSSLGPTPIPMATSILEEFKVKNGGLESSLQEVINEFTW
jgi:energy-coupling factor transporter ATP-binding protein EcfA2